MTKYLSGSFPETLRFTFYPENGSPLNFQVSLRRAWRIFFLFSLWMIVSPLILAFGLHEADENHALAEKLAFVQAQLDLQAQLWVAPSKVVPATTSSASLASDFVGAAAHISNVYARCQGMECDVRFTLLAQSGVDGVGSMSVVLESEVPRVGSSDPLATPKKKYTVYPGNKSYEAMSDADVAGLAVKPFHFAHTLPVTVTFSHPLVQHPIAAHIYLFDANHRIQAHQQTVPEKAEDAEL